MIVKGIVLKNIIIFPEDLVLIMFPIWFNENILKISSPELFTTGVLFPIVTKKLGFENTYVA